MDNLSFNEYESKMEKTKEETDKKCPACGGTMDFDPASGKLKCLYCESEYDIGTQEEASPAQEQDFFEAEKTGNCDWGKETKVIICKSCGGESVYDALTTSSECPYCGSNQVMEQADKDTIAPGGVCVFKIDAQKAAGNFKSWLSKKWFCPKAAKQNARPEEIKGIYLPFWTFDSDTTTKYNGEYGIDRTVRRGDETKTVTDWYRVGGTHREFIDDQLVLGSSRHPASLLKGLEPFHTADNTAYRPEYIAGFAAERYSIGLKDAWEKAKGFIRVRLIDNIKKKIRTDKHADHVRNLNTYISFDNIKYKYLLLPVWMAHFEYKGKIYQFMVNGQTGKVSGKIPLSAAKIALTVALAVAALALLWYLTN